MFAVLMHKWNISHFLLAYITYHLKYNYFGTKMVPIPRGRDIHCNTVKLKGFFCFLSSDNNCQNYLMFVIYFSQQLNR